MEKRVLIYSVGTIRLSVTAHVRCDDPIPRLGESLDLVPPRIPGLRKSVAQKNQRSGARFRDMDFDAVRFNKLVFGLHREPRCKFFSNNCFVAAFSKKFRLRAAISVSLYSLEHD